MRTLKEFGVGKSFLQTVINDEVAKLVEELREESGKSINLKFRFRIAVVNTLWQILNGEKSDMKNPQMAKVFRSTAEFVVETSLSGLRNLPFFNKKSELSYRQLDKTFIGGFLETEE